MDEMKFGINPSQADQGKRYPEIGEDRPNWRKGFKKGGDKKGSGFLTQKTSGIGEDGIVNDIRPSQRKKR